MAKISIIIPVYNVEKYLEQCLDSILSQSFKDIEVICINDDSPDNCPLILDKYAKQDSRIKVLHKSNEGQGSARNDGLKLANGKYVMFVDSDDWLEPEALDKLYSKIEEDDTDAVFFNAYKSDALTGAKIKDAYTQPYYAICRETPFCPTEVGEVIYKTAPLCFKIYKTDFLKKHNIVFSNHKFWEDHPHHFRLLAQAEKIRVLNAYLYNYRTHGASATANAQKYAPSLFENFCICEKAVEDTKHGEKFIPYLVERKVNVMFYYLSKLDKEYRKTWYLNMKKVFKYIEQKYGGDILKNDKYRKRYELVQHLPYELYCLYSNIHKTKFLVKNRI